MHQYRSSKTPVKQSSSYKKKYELNRIFLSLKEAIKKEELLDDSIGFQELEQDSDQKNNPDLASIASQLDSNETLSLVDSDYDFCEEIQQAENDDDSIPLFLHFTCTVKSGIEYENISVKKLVPCIGKSVSHYGVKCIVWFLLSLWGLNFVI